MNWICFRVFPSLAVHCVTHNIRPQLHFQDIFSPIPPSVQTDKRIVLLPTAANTAKSHDFPLLQTNTALSKQLWKYFGVVDKHLRPRIQ